MRSTAAAGMEFRSLLMTRWPSTSTRVRCGPSPRKPTRVAPLPAPLLSCGFVPTPINAGNWFITPPSVSSPVCWICCAVTPMTGLSVSMSARRMCEPVTSTVCNVFGCCAWAFPAFCAKAGSAVLALITAPVAMAARIARDIGCLMGLIPFPRLSLMVESIDDFGSFASGSCADLWQRVGDVQRLERGIHPLQAECSALPQLPRPSLAIAMAWCLVSPLPDSCGNRHNETNVRRCLLLPVPLIPADELARLLGKLSDVVFFVKDREGRYAQVNQTLALRLGLKHPDDVVGRDPRDVFPDPLGGIYRAQDQQVLGGQSLENRLEVHLFPDRVPGWCLTDKYPLR